MMRNAARMRYGAGRRRGVAWLLGMLLAGLAALPGHASTDADITARMESMLEAQALTGAAWMLLTPDEGVVTGAAGRRLAGSATPISPDDRFHVGSIAKTVMATGVLRLVTLRRVSLDTPVQDILTDVRWDNPWNRTHPVLLRHLLDHTAGLEDASFRHVFSGSARPDSPLGDVFEGDPPLVVVRTRPGSEYSYSNLGYVLVAMVIERVVGQRYETYLDAHLLRPLGMTSSTFAYTPRTVGQTAPVIVGGHVDGAVPQPMAPTRLRPAGQFLTTAADMGAFARFLLGDGAIDGSVFVDTELLRAMGRQTGTAAAKAGLEAGYALGIWRRDRHGAVGLCHEGSTVGFRALLCLYPQDRKAFFIAFNMDSETADYGLFDALMIERLALARTPVAPAVASADDDLDAWMGWYRRDPGKIPAFEYLDLVFNPVSIARKGKDLRLYPLFAEESTLTPLGDRRFRATGRALASHVLLTGEAGPEWSNGYSTYRKVDSWILIALWANLALGLAGVLYVFVIGGWRLLRRARDFPSDPLAPAWLILAGIPLAGILLGRSWQRMGDLTLASGLLAVLTAALPLAAGWGVWRIVKRADRPARRRRLDAWMLIAIAQWCVVLAAWSMLPLRTWA